MTVLAGVGLGAPVHGQGRAEPDAFVNQQREIEERVRAELDAQRPATEKVEFDYGGWYSFHLFIYDDGVNSSRTFRRNDLRVWGRMAFDEGAHTLYARGRMSYLDFNTGDSFDGRDSDWEGPNLERGFYQFDLRRALRSSTGRHIDHNLTFKVGRDLATFGTGYAFSTVLDQVWLRGEWRDLAVTGLVGQTVGSSEEMDSSRLTTRTRRSFFGAEARYRGFERHEPFAYVLWQSDHNRDELPHLLQDYDYDSFYVGLGAEGELLTDLRYSAEWVYEGGRSYGHRRFIQRDVIRAWALDAELEYLFDAKGKPRASLEYMFASGDSGRLGSPTNAAGGNQGDSTDRGFNGFGWRDTGLSHAPTLSNIHIWRAGASFHPFDDTRLFTHLELGTDWYLYHKHHRRGATSDVTTDQTSGYLGWEMDFFANWDITPDVAWTARYGVFFPGKAYSDQTTRTFFLVGVTWRF
ncbi:MAG: alginate export family protein [bacterium]|nr:alginate export family protein [bacterium]